MTKDLRPWTVDRRPIVAALLALVFASGELAAQNPAIAPAPAPRGGQNRGRGGIRIMTLTSSAFVDGGVIPAKYAQQGRDVSPALQWFGAPDSVASYVLIVHDEDAASGNGLDDALHWMVWNIPASATILPEGIKQGPTVPGLFANPIRQISMSGPYYRGPAAPSTGAPHHYVFELYALDANINVQPVGQSPAETREAVLEAMEGHIRGKGVLMGLYRRSDPPQP